MYLYALEMIKDMRSRKSLSAASIGLASSKQGRDEMLKGNMDMYRLIVYVQKIEEDKMRDREEYIHKKLR